MRSPTKNDHFHSTGVLRAVAADGYTLRLYVKDLAPNKAAVYPVLATVIVGV